MKKYVASIVAILLLLTAVPAFAANEVIAVNVQINDKALQFPDAQPHERNGIPMVPIRTAADNLGLDVSFDSKTRDIVLEGPGVHIAFTTGSSVANDGDARLSFDTPAITVKNRVYVPLAFFEKVLGLTTSYDTATKTASIAAMPVAPETTVEHVVSLLQEGKHQQLADRYFADNLKQIISMDELDAVWKQITATAGSYIEIIDVYQAMMDENIELTEAHLKFEKANFKLVYPTDNNGKFMDLKLMPLPIEAEKPQEVVEEEIVIGKGTAYELGGTLTLPKNVNGPVPAIVLVHGSGPNDRDETAFGFKPFRDIAYGLAKQGVAVLRYDKRTYAHANSFTPEDAKKITVKEETVDDAILAGKLLKSDKRIDSTQVYLAGHSLGGMLAPRIDAEGGDFAGLVLIAGSPRTLWEIIHDQGLDAVAAMDANHPARPATEAWLASEYAKAKSIADMSAAEAAKTTAFGIPAIYFKEMDSHSTADYAAKLTKPVLVLQGETDFQVYADKDYVRWQELFKGKTNASFKLYPNMNHFLVEYDGPGAGTTKEYLAPGLVSPKLIDDIASWILKLQK
ncbi:alpha/beta fold hydrolase [Paenibacillaceae bacterium]|nr:alpha/beta fold hydrolase [Paenibacillaceae bacterium]